MYRVHRVSYFPIINTIVRSIMIIILQSVLRDIGKTFCEKIQKHFMETGRLHTHVNIPDQY